MNGDIAVISLKSTLALMGVVIKETSDEIVLQKPVSILTEISQGEMKYAYAPFLEFTYEYFDGMTFSFDDIVVRCTPIDDMKDEYVKTYVS